MTKNKSTKEPIRCLRQWGASFGLPYRAKTDNGPGYRDEFRAECKALGIEVIHSSCYNAPSQGLIEQKVGLFKELLKKSISSLNQLQIDELIFEVNAREEPSKGSAMTRFLGRGLRHKIPNSVDRTVDGKELIRIRRETREKRVKKKGRTEEKN